MTNPSSARRWLSTLARHYPSLLVSGVCHAALGEMDRLEAGCTGCAMAPTEGENYHYDCMSCRRFYGDLYVTERETE
jgi:hypothetical protein